MTLINDFTANLAFKVLDCAHCGIQFAITKDFDRRRREDHETFYCPKGHDQYFPQENEKERLKRQLKDVQACCVRYQNRTEYLERSRSSYRGHFNRVKREVEGSGGNGDGA